MICTTVVVIIWIIRFIMEYHWMVIFVIAFWLSFYTFFIILKLYEKINGIYKNGIIYNGFTSWNEIQSYNILNEKSIFIITKDGDGNGIVFNDVCNLEEVIEIMNINNIKEIL